MDAALKIMKALVDNHCDFSDDSEAILKNVTGSYAADFHVSRVYCEYYFVEAMYKLKGFEPMFW